MDRMHLLDLLRLGLYPVILCAVIGTDLTRRIIPNLLVGALVLGFAAVALASPVSDLGLRLLVAGSVTGIGFALFAQDVIGAGDAKLAGALVLWLDPEQVPLFLLACGLIGALLTLAATLKARPQPLPTPARLFARTGQTLPYGVALAGAGLLLQPYSSLMQIS